MSESKSNYIIKSGGFIKIMSSIFLIIIFQLLSCQSKVQNNSKVKIDENAQNKINRVDINKFLSNNSINTDSDFSRNFDLWNKNNITNYNITVSVSQGGNVVYPDSAVIEVREGKAVSVTFGSNSDEALEKKYDEINTINKIFEMIRQGLEKEAKVDIKYNKEFGYPENILIDDIKKGIDSWMIIKISKFEVVN